MGVASPISLATSSVSAQGYTGRLILQGYSFRETTGTAGATVIIRDGTSTAGNYIIGITLAANESTGSVSIATGSDDGIQLAVGVYFHVVTGSVEGSVWGIK